MKNLRKSWKLIALFALAAIVCLIYVGRSRADIFVIDQDLNSGLVQPSLDQWIHTNITNYSDHTKHFTKQWEDGKGASVGAPIQVTLPAGWTDSEDFLPPLATGHDPITQMDYVVHAPVRLAVHPEEGEGDLRGVLTLNSLQPDGTITSSNGSLISPFSFGAANPR